MQIRFVSSVRLSVCSFVRFSIRWSLRLFRPSMSLSWVCHRCRIWYGMDAWIGVLVIDRLNVIGGQVSCRRLKRHWHLSSSPLNTVHASSTIQRRAEDDCTICTLPMFDIFKGLFFTVIIWRNKNNNSQINSWRCEYEWVEYNAQTDSEGHLRGGQKLRKNTIGLYKYQCQYQLFLLSSR